VPRAAEECQEQRRVLVLSEGLQVWDQDVGAVRIEVRVNGHSPETQAARTRSLRSAPEHYGERTLFLLDS
jgi:hypothetical protein